MSQHAPIAIGNETKRLLDRAVKIAGGDPELHLKRAIERYLEDLEDIRAADEVLRERARTGGAGTVTLDQLGAELGLDD